MKSNKVIWFHLLVLVVLLVINFCQIFNISVFNGFYYGDSEVMAYIAHILGSGGRFYQDFSIVYGPGRFVALAFINKLMGVEMSIPLFYSYGALVGLVLVPWAIYWLTYKLVAVKNKVGHILIALTPLFGYLFFLRVGQDTHLIILLFICFWAKYQENNKKTWAIISGLLLGLIGFFRIESGIFALISVIVIEFISHKDEKNKKYFWISYLLFQTIYFLLVTFYGSLTNFFHDVVILGILSQPKIMKIPIQAVDFPLFEFFMLLNIFVVLMAKYSKNKTFMLLSAMSLLGYANALGRADFDHLYYGIVLLIPTIVVAIYYLIKKWGLIRHEKINPKMILILGLLMVLELMMVKKQITFMLPILLIIIFYINIVLKKELGFLLILILIISGHTMLRSISLFKFYFLKQFQLPSIISVNKIPDNTKKYFSLIKKCNYGGYQLDDKNSSSLTKMKEDLKDESIFIYPSHATLYQALGKNPPIRYLYFNNEYTKRMEVETIEMLKNKKIEHILLSSELTKEDAIVPNQTKLIEKFIFENYQKEKEYDFGNDNFVLMKKSITSL